MNKTAVYKRECKEGAFGEESHESVTDVECRQLTQVFCHVRKKSKDEPTCVKVSNTTLQLNEEDKRSLFAFVILLT